MQDPRQNGFNYSTGWGSAPKPTLYAEATLKCQELSAAAKTLSQEAWDLEHALWVMRIATGDEEKRIALEHLTEKMNRYHNQKSEAA